jgi:hypothetical protein
MKKIKKIRMNPDENAGLYAPATLFVINLTADA